MDKLKAVAPYAKAIAGFIVAGLTAYSTARSDGHITNDETINIIVAALAGGGIVYAVPNKKVKPPQA